MHFSAPTVPVGRCSFTQAAPELLSQAKASTCKSTVDLLQGIPYDSCAFFTFLARCRAESVQLTVLCQAGSRCVTISSLCFGTVWTLGLPWIDHSGMTMFRSISGEAAFVQVECISAICIVYLK